MKRRIKMDLDYQNIVDKLIDILPMKWENAIFMVEYTSGSYSMRCYSKELSGNFVDVMKFEGVSKASIVKIYKSLNEIFQKNRNELSDSCWYAMTLTFNKDGKFKTDFDYNSHDGNVLGFIEDWIQNNIS